MVSRSLFSSYLFLSLPGGTLHTFQLLFSSIMTIVKDSLHTLEVPVLLSLAKMSLSTFNILLSSFLLYLIGLVFYRLHLHPLSSHPGPFLASITDWFVPHLHSSALTNSIQVQCLPRVPRRPSPRSPQSPPQIRPCSSLCSKPHLNQHLIRSEINLRPFPTISLATKIVILLCIPCCQRRLQHPQRNL